MAFLLEIINFKSCFVNAHSVLIIKITPQQFWDVCPSVWCGIQIFIHTLQTLTHISRNCSFEEFYLYSGSQVMYQNSSYSQLVILFASARPSRLQQTYLLMSTSCNTLGLASYNRNICYTLMVFNLRNFAPYFHQTWINILIFLSLSQR